MHSPFLVVHQCPDVHKTCLLQLHHDAATRHELANKEPSPENKALLRRMIYSADLLKDNTVFATMRVHC